MPLPSVVEVVGAYRVVLTDDARWLDPRVFRHRAALRDGEREVPPQLPAVLVPYELLDALRVTTLQTTVRRTIDASDRRAADLPILRAALAEHRGTAERTPDAAVPDVPAGGRRRPGPGTAGTARSRAGRGCPAAAPVVVRPLPRRLHHQAARSDEVAL